MPSSVTMPFSFAIYRPSSVPSRAISEIEISGIVPPSPRGKACALSNVVLKKISFGLFLQSETVVIKTTVADCKKSNFCLFVMVIF